MNAETRGCRRGWESGREQMSTHPWVRGVAFHLRLQEHHCAGRGGDGRAKEEEEGQPWQSWTQRLQMPTLCLYKSRPIDSRAELFPSRFRERVSHRFQVCTHWWLHCSPVGRSGQMLTQRAVVKWNNSQNKAGSQGIVWDFGEEWWEWEGDVGRESLQL